ncbi:MAG: type II toxin-antitoxin system RelE/ParE family toxin [Rhodoferax sp.]|nr:type II toxin-antitoxin system RelE/ParE family toxin [Rhodoferax sp.]MBP9684604.1 type II toxin-antitoxin system RelE/ParE family toxin [Rhodoferax sp.]
MRVRFEELAKLEFDDARAWYRAIRPELAQSFTREVRAATQRMSHMPLLYPLERGDVRRCVLTQFSYTLRYAVRGDLILILSVSHQHRDPDYWVDRITSE